MINVFVSRPTYVHKVFDPGLNCFIQLLKAHGLTPRTLGSTDYPTVSPLDEVISIMKECCGAVVLGYPQIEVKHALVKDKEFKETSDNLLYLGTEWNHIEAALAYAQKLPLLVTHHLNIKRGIFDRGTLNSFIYEKDLSKPDWCMQEEFVLAIQKWKQRVLGYKPENEAITNIAADFIDKFGVLWKKDGLNIEPFAYCPKCKMAMHAFPPGSNELLICNCGFNAPFRPNDMKNYISQINMSL